MSGGISPEMKNGTIIMWAGSMHEIPNGWALCDGNDGRPNLQDRFIIGAGSHYPIGQIGGNEFHNHDATTLPHSLTANELPQHSHRIGTGGADSYQMAPGGVTQRLAHFVNDQYNGGTPKSTHTDGGSNKGHSHGINRDSNLPPYYALAFLVKL